MRQTPRQRSARSGATTRLHENTHAADPNGGRRARLTAGASSVVVAGEPSVVLDFAMLPSLNESNAAKNRHYAIGGKHTGEWRSTGYYVANALLARQRTGLGAQEVLIGCPVALVWDVYYASNVRRDVPNLDTKPVIDGLTDARLWQDDNFRVVRQSLVRFGGTRPKAHVTPFHLLALGGAADRSGAPTRRRRTSPNYCNKSSRTCPRTRRAPYAPPSADDVRRSSRIRPRYGAAALLAQLGEASTGLLAVWEENLEILPRRLTRSGQRRLQTTASGDGLLLRAQSAHGSPRGSARTAP